VCISIPVGDLDHRPDLRVSVAPLLLEEHAAGLSVHAPLVVDAPLALDGPNLDKDGVCCSVHDIRRLGARRLEPLLHCLLPCTPRVLGRLKITRVVVLQQLQRMLEGEGFFCCLRGCLNPLPLAHRQDALDLLQERLQLVQARGDGQPGRVYHGQGPAEPVLAQRGRALLTHHRL